MPRLFRVYAIVPHAWRSGLVNRPEWIAVLATSDDDVRAAIEDELPGATVVRIEAVQGRVARLK